MAVDYSLVRVVVFDLDDTLCGYWDAAKAGLRAAFERHGPEGRTVDECVAAWAEAFRDFCPNLKELGWYEQYLDEGAWTRVETMRKALANLGVEDEDRAVSLSDAYARARDVSLTLFPDAIATLEKIRERYRLGMITNGPADIQRQEIATLKLEPFFDWVLIEGEMRIGKPAEVVFRRLEELSGCAPSEILFVGNSYRHDIAPAISAGWKTAWVRRPSDVAPSASGPETKPEGAPEPDLTIADLSELLPVLGLG